MANISRAFVVANQKKSTAVRIKKEVERLLLENGIALSASSPQLIITLGGDGTVLFSKKHYGVPYFAIGSKTSFICQATFADWKGKLPRAIRSPKHEGRLLLEAALNGKRLPLSLNEIGIRNPEPRILSIHIACGKKHYAFRADGIIFSTPTGSPAYCFSCGGKQMKRTDGSYQAVAISPFRRIFKPLILPSSRACTLRISGPERAQLFIDGQVIGTFTEKNTLRIRGSKKKFLFAMV